MSILYTIALCVVFLGCIALTLEAVLAVSKPKPWDGAAAPLSLVQTQDRRVNDLRYIGPERRADRIAAEEAAARADRLAA